MNDRTYPDAGMLLYDTINLICERNDKIVLDMNGVDLLSSMFLNVSIGRLIKERGVH